MYVRKFRIKGFQKIGVPLLGSLSLGLEYIEYIGVDLKVSMFLETTILCSTSCTPCKKGQPTRNIPM